MRVCMITPRYPPDRCGVGDYTRLLARHLTGRGVDVTVVTSRLAGAHGGAEGDDGVYVLPAIAGWGWASLLPLCAVITVGRYDVVHVQYQNEMYGRSASIIALPLILRALRPRLPVVVTVHDYGTPWPRRVRVRALAGPYGKAWFLAMLLASRRIVLTNEQDEWRFLRQRVRYPVPAGRYVTIPIGSNLPAPLTMPKERERKRGQEMSRIEIGYFGFVNAAKGVETLLDAVALARGTRPDLHLTMICALRADDPYQRTILARLRAPDLRGAVTVTGELDEEDAAATLARCALVALPFRDGISLRRTTLMAALALGRPVISTRADVAPAALREGRDVLLVPPGDAPALAGAIVGLAGDAARRDELGRHAREAARAFTWPEIAARTEQLYQELAGATNPAGWG